MWAYAITYRMPHCRNVTMLRMRDVAKNVLQYVSIYVTLFFNDVTRFMYRDTIRYRSIPNLELLLYNIHIRVPEQKKKTF